MRAAEGCWLISLAPRFHRGPPLSPSRHLSPTRTHVRSVSRLWQLVPFPPRPHVTPPFPMRATTFVACLALASTAIAAPDSLDGPQSSPRPGCFLTNKKLSRCLDTAAYVSSAPSLDCGCSKQRGWTPSDPDYELTLHRLNPADVRRTVARPAPSVRGRHSVCARRTPTRPRAGPTTNVLSGTRR